VQAIDRLRAATLDGPGELDPELRRAAAAGTLDGPAGDFVRKVHTGAHRMVDADVLALREAGWNDEAIFELTVAAALGAGLERLDAGLRAR
jgi:alkylhydroperoxidase family enzyme